jgi:hypothetical protein
VHGPFGVAAWGRYWSLGSTVRGTCSSPDQRCRRSGARRA